ncbi:MAG: hypothetical protein R2798_10225 [Chitinophagales bacterium]|nr:hypothetical protein [Bacteroidota bacterium]MCB9044060.1 hypothetical protein [Chitinophagales bacterium]
MSCQNQNNISEKDALPSFNFGIAKQNIVSFIQMITDENSTEYVAPEDRVAVFDNDGTLWVEQPLPSQIYFTFDRLKELAKTEPDLANEMPYKAVVDNDMAAIAHFTKENVVKIVGKANEIDNVTKFYSAILVTNCQTSRTTPKIYRFGLSAYAGIVGLSAKK